MKNKGVTVNVSGKILNKTQSIDVEMLIREKAKDLILRRYKRLKDTLLSDLKITNVTYNDFGNSSEEKDGVIIYFTFLRNGNLVEDWERFLAIENIGNQFLTGNKRLDNFTKRNIIVERLWDQRYDGNGKRIFLQSW